MAHASEDPPSPVDAYQAYGSAPAAGAVPPPPPASPTYPNSPQYGGYAYAVPAPRTNVLAIISLVASCAGVLIPFAYVAGVILGHIALSQIKRTGETGRGLALAGVIVGYALLAISLVVVVVYVIFLIFIVGLAGSAGDFNSSNFG